MARLRRLQGWCSFRIMIQRLMIPAACIVLAITPSCADESAAQSMELYPSGSLVIGPKEGIDFKTGEKMSPGTFANSDIYAAENGDALSLLPGGETSANSRPVNWFQPGGTAQHFDSLADVPSDADDIPTGYGFSLPNADIGNAFIVENARENDADPHTYTKGWISDATASTVTIEFEAL